MPANNLRAFARQAVTRKCHSPQFACDPGYELMDGPERLTCEDDENWNGIMFNCRPVIVVVSLK